MGTCIHPFVCRENPNRVVPRPDTERASPEQCSLVALCGGLGAGEGARFPGCTRQGFSSEKPDQLAAVARSPRTWERRSQRVPPTTRVSLVS